MKISIPITDTDGNSLTKVITTNVIDATPELNPSEQVALIPKDMDYLYDNKIYRNSEDVPVVPYDALYEDTYENGDIVYKDGSLTRFEYLLGLFKKQPWEYSVTQNSGYDHTLWDTRYTKLQDIPSDFNGYDETVLIALSSTQASRMSPDGTKLITVDYAHYINEYTLSSPHDMHTATLTRRYEMTALSNIPIDLAISSAGTRILVLSSTNIFQFTLGSAYSLSSVTYNGYKPVCTVGSSCSNVDSGSSFTSIEFNNTGNALFITYNYPTDYTTVGLTTTIKWSLSTAWSVLGTVTYQTQFGILPPIWIYTTNPHGGAIKRTRFVNNGTELWISGGSWYHYGIYRYTLSVAYDMNSTRTLIGYCDEPDEFTSHSILVNPNGLSFYFCQGNEFIKYQTPVAFDLSQSLYSSGRYTRYVFNSQTDMYYFSVYPYYNYTTNKASSTRRYDLTRGSASQLAGSYNSVAYWHTTLTNASTEIKATIFDDGTGGELFRPNTIIYEGAGGGIWLRTHIEAQIEFDELDVATYTPIVEPLDIPTFYYLMESNPYRPFDNKNYSYATSDLIMTYTLKGDIQFDTLALGNVKASHIYAVFKKLDGTVVTTIDSDINTQRDTHGHLPDWYTTIIMYSEEVMEAGSTVELTLTMPSSDSVIELATILLGISAEAGFTNLTLKNEYRDFSNFEYDTFGNVDYTERAKVSRYSGTVDIPITSYDMTDRLMTSLGANLVIVNGSDDGSCGCDSRNIFNATQKIGRFTSFSQNTKIKDDDMDVIATYSFTLEEIV